MWSNLIIIKEKIWKNIYKLIMVISWKGSGTKDLCSRGHFDYLNYLNFYNVNYICITFIIKTKVKPTFNNEWRKEGRQAGKKTPYILETKKNWGTMERREKRGLKIFKRNIKGKKDTQENFKEILLWSVIQPHLRYFLARLSKDLNQVHLIENNNN